MKTKRLFEEEAENPQQANDSHPKCRWLAVLVFALMLLLGGQVAWFQLIKTDELAAWARNQQDYMTLMPGERGALCDRKGVVLNKSVPKYDLALRIEAIRDPRDTRRRTLDKVCSVAADLGSFLGPEFYLHRPTRDKALKHIRQNTPLPIILWRDLDRNTIERWVANKNNFPGSELVMSWKRHYEMPDSLFHVRGFTGLGQPIDPPEIKNFKLIYEELIGRSGIEEELNPKLCGYAGYELLRTDVLAYRMDVAESLAAVRGKDVCLTIDIELQQGIEKTFRTNGYSGALLLMDLNTGEVLACVSEPCPLLPYSKSTDSKGAMLNRALAGFYPPGSTLKPLVAMTALSQGVVDSKETIICRGAYTLPDGRSLACSRKSGHGEVNLTQALAMSCNVFFCVLGQRLGAEKMDLVGSSVGMGKRPNTELWRQEGMGINFTPAWVREKRQEQPAWTTGDSANAAIGQGAWIVTPLQLLIATSAVVTGKKILPTFIAGSFHQPTGELNWASEHCAVIKEGMRQCVNSPSGTGRALRIDGVTVIGKTGTAQAGPGKNSHALVTAALPAEKPRIVGVCVIEHGGGGGRVAGPVLQEALSLALQLGY